MSKKNFSFSNFFGFDDEYVDQPEEATRNANRGRRNVVSINDSKRKLIPNIKINVVQITSYKEAQSIAQKLLEQEAIVVNFTKLSPDDTIRVIDYLNGVIFAISGSLTRVSEDIFIGVPSGFDIEGIINDSEF